VYGSEAILLADIAFRAPWVENFDEKSWLLPGKKMLIALKKST
jgi:hypothetical protein